MALESKKYSLEYVVEEINFCCLLFFYWRGGKTCRYEKQNDGKRLRIKFLEILFLRLKNNLKLKKFKNSLKVITWHLKVSSCNDYILPIKKSAITTTTTTKNDGNMESFLRGMEAMDPTSSFSFSSSTPFLPCNIYYNPHERDEEKSSEKCELISQKRKKIFISWISPCEDDMVKGGKWWKKKIGFRDSSLETRKNGERKWGKIFSNQRPPLLSQSL